MLFRVEIVIAAAGGVQFLMRAALDDAARLPPPGSDRRAGWWTSRCAITNVVRPCIRYLKPSWIIASDSESRLDVASSRIKIRGSARIARAIETRCRWPPESFTPRSPTIVSYPFSKLSANSSTRAMRQASRICSFGGIGPRERHVLSDGAVEEKRVLQHHAQLRAIRIQANGGKIDAIHQNPFPIPGT